jgi:hypothetical protein
MKNARPFPRLVIAAMACVTFTLACSLSFIAGYRDGLRDSYSPGKSPSSTTITPTAGEEPESILEKSIGNSTLIVHD